MTEGLAVNRFENVTRMIRYHNDKMVEAFTRFVRISIGIVAGSFGLFFLGEVEKDVRLLVLHAVPALIGFLGVSSIALIFSNWKSWYSYRKAESELLEDPSLRPRLPRAASEQIIMLIIIFLTWGMGSYVYYCVLPEKLA